MFKNIYDAGMFLGYGGAVTVIGGLIGYFVLGMGMLEAEEPAIFGIIGLLPGILIAVFEKIEKDRKAKEETIRWRKEMERLGFSDEVLKIMNETKQK